MRLYLFPITRSRTLLYCKRIQPPILPASPSSSSPQPDSQSQSQSNTPSPPPPKPPLLDRITARANSTWVTWESAPSGWKKTVTTWGNQIFARIPYTEWGLKSIPPLSKARRAELVSLSSDPSDSSRRRAGEVDVVYPTRLFKESEIKELLGKIARENKGAYSRKMWWSIIAMPFTAPFALVPVVPNLPFFFLVFRAWSFWRAERGCSHVEFLLQRDLLRSRPSEVLQRLWEVGKVEKGRLEELEGRIQQLKGLEGGDGKEGGKEALRPEDEEVEKVAMEVLGHGVAQTDPQIEGVDGQETILYPKGHGKVVGLTLNMPEVDVELERAYDQVSKELAKNKS